MTYVAGPVVVAGAGQAGALLAIYLARQGNDVTVYESRPDLRRTDIDAVPFCIGLKRKRLNTIGSQNHGQKFEQRTLAGAAFTHESQLGPPPDVQPRDGQGIFRTTRGIAFHHFA